MPLTANSSGQLSGSFAIPANVPAGTQKFEITGSSGSKGEALFTGGGIIKNQTLQLVTSIVNRYDPLAQTFTLTEARILTGIQLKFCAKGSKVVTIQLRECLVGIPNDVVLAEGRIEPAAITLNAWAQILFDMPTPAQAGREYAIVVMSDEATPSVAIAELGKIVQPGDGPNPGYITSQPIVNGVLLSSSNASTWTPHQNMDLTFKLLAAKFAPTTRTVDFGDIPVTNLTDMILKANVMRPSSSCDVRFEITVQSTGVVYRVGENEALALSAKIISDTVNVKAILTGDVNMSPYLYPGSLLVKGELAGIGNYHSVAITAAASFNIVVTLDVFNPGSSTIAPYVQVHTQVSGVDQYSGGVPVTEYLSVATDPLFVPVDLGDGWVQVSFKRTSLRGIGPQRYTRIRLDVAGTPQYRPKVRNIRAFTKLP